MGYKTMSIFFAFLSISSKFLITRLPACLFLDCISIEKIVRIRPIPFVLLTIMAIFQLTAEPLALSLSFLSPIGLD